VVMVDDFHGARQTFVPNMRTLPQAMIQRWSYRKGKEDHKLKPRGEVAAGRESKTDHYLFSGSREEIFRRKIFRGAQDLAPTTHKLKEKKKEDRGKMAPKKKSGKTNELCSGKD